MRRPHRMLWPQAALALATLAMLASLWGSFVHAGASTFSAVMGMVTVVILILTAVAQGVLWERYSHPMQALDAAYVMGYFHAHGEVSRVLEEYVQKAQANQGTVDGQELMEALSRTIEVRVAHDERFSGFIATREDPDKHA